MSGRLRRFVCTEISVLRAEKSVAEIVVSVQKIQGSKRKIFVWLFSLCVVDSQRAVSPLIGRLAPNPVAKDGILDDI